MENNLVEISTVKGLNAKYNLMNEFDAKQFESDKSVVGDTMYLLDKSMKLIESFNEEKDAITPNDIQKIIVRDFDDKLTIDMEIVALYKGMLRELRGLMTLHKTKIVNDSYIINNSKYNVEDFIYIGNKLNYFDNLTITKDDIEMVFTSKEIPQD